jgi:predicted polyphosphate/ATP-dependent NAD kinase
LAIKKGFARGARRQQIFTIIKVKKCCGFRVEGYQITVRRRQWQAVNPTVIPSTLFLIPYTF